MNEAKRSGEMSRTVWYGGLTVRTIFIAILIFITARVASPQMEHLWSIYETPSDLARVKAPRGVTGTAAAFVGATVPPKAVMQPRSSNGVSGQATIVASGMTTPLPSSSAAAVASLRDATVRAAPKGTPASASRARAAA